VTFGFTAWTYICLPDSRVCPERVGRFQQGASQALNSYVLNIALPALVLVTVHQWVPSWEFLWAALMPWANFILSFCVVSLIGRGSGGSVRCVAVSLSWLEWAILPLWGIRFCRRSTGPRRFRSVSPRIRAGRFLSILRLRCDRCLLFIQHET